MYHYAGNNPVKYTDPDGKDIEDVKNPEEKTIIKRTERVLRAAHKFSAMREFQMLSVVNEPYRTKDIEKQLNQDIESFLDLRGFQRSPGGNLPLKIRFV